MKWGSTAKKLKKYKVVLIKDYVEIINTALEQKADWHFHNNKMVKNKIGKKVPIDKAIGAFCLMIKDCVEQQYKQQRKRS